MQPLELVYPVRDPVVISQPFGVNWTGDPTFYTKHGLPLHEGTDFDGDEGDAVFAVADGVVKLIARDNGKHAYGNHIRVTHVLNGDTYESVYAHLRGFVPGLVAGSKVQAGETLGFMGSTGAAKGTHLHLTFKKMGATARGEKQPLPDGRKITYPKDVVNAEPFFRK